MKKNYKKAESSFRECLSLQADYFAAHYELAQLYYDLKNFSGAVLELQQTLTYAPGNHAILRKIEEVKWEALGASHAR